MAQKRQRRSEARQRRQQSLQERNSKIPPSALDFKSPSPTAVGTSSDGEEQQQANATTSRAKQLVDAQRESVQMLTHVTEQLEARIVSVQDMLTALNERGYYVVDELLRDNVVQQLQNESLSLYFVESHEMTPDVNALGSGEFLAAVQGGPEQYPKCPRTIEWVVSVTGKLAALINTQQQLLDYSLDDRACSKAVVRLFDRSSLQASLHLLMGQNSPEALQQAIQNLKPPPLQTVLERDATADRRKISVSYFLTPPEWDHAYGGHLTFATATTEPTTVHAKRNRLVIYKSDTTLVRREPFRGSDDMTTASCLELHLVQRRK
jgi:hypothetical protein